LVKDATVQVSTLVRAEVALAKAELFGELKKAVVGSIFFIVALVVLGLSSVYFFFFFVALLHAWGLSWWAASGILFLVMLLVAALAAGLGVWRIMKIHAPRKTIKSLHQVAEVLPNLSGRSHEDAGDLNYATSSFTAPTAR
jgi:hypothetical protein